jgi:hypothetical protein
MQKSIIIILFTFLHLRGVSQQYIVVGDSSSSYITYNNIRDTVVPFIAKSSYSVELDIDYDGIKDLRFYRAHASSPAFSQINEEIYSLDSVQFIRTLSNSTNCDTLVINDTINSSSNWNSNYSYGNLYYSFSGPPPPWGPGSSASGICKKNNTYIGFRKFNGSDTIYGWVLIDFQGTYMIRSYAINKKINQVGLQENIKIEQLLLYPVPTTDVLYIQNIDQIVTGLPLTLYNLNGVSLNVEINFVNNRTYKLKLTIYQMVFILFSYQQLRVI